MLSSLPPREQLISCLTLHPTALTLAQGPPVPDFRNRGSVGPVPKLCTVTFCSPWLSRDEASSWCHDQLLPALCPLANRAPCHFYRPCPEALHMPP